jgi:hypothetical protein
MKTMPYPVRLPPHLLELADIRADTEQVDRSTALRQLLYAGAIGYVLDLLHAGRISLSRAGELLILRGCYASRDCRNSAGVRMRTRWKGVSVRMSVSPVMRD